MPLNITHNRKTWQAIGNRGDPVAFDVSGEHSMISLLKGILAEMGIPFIPDHSISFSKLQQVVGPTVLGRGPGLGEVLPLPMGRGVDVVVDLVGAKLQVVPDVPMKSEANVWLGQNTFQNPVNVPDGALGLSIYSTGDLTKRVRFDLSTMPTGNTITVRMPTVGLDGGPDIGFLALLKNGTTFAQPLNDNLSALSSLTAVNTIYYRSGSNPSIWSPVVIGANLQFTDGTLSSTGAGGGGGVSTAGPVTAAMLTGYADASGTLIQGVTVVGPGIAYASGLLSTTGDLLALENLTGTNTIYYRVADATWNPVTISTGLTFTSGNLAVSSVLAAFVGLSPVADTVPYFTAPNNAALTAFTAFGRSLVGTANAAAALTLLGAQPLDGDLTAIANLAGTNTIYYRSGTSTWSPVTFSGLTFSGGVLTATGGGGGVTTSGPVTSAMLTGYADATGLLIRGITMPGAGLTLTGAALTLANDLAALEALGGSNTIYYRIGTDSWGPVTIGTNLTFSGGVLNATAAGGGVTTSGAVTSSMMTGYADSTGTLIRGINLPAAGISLSGNNMVLTNDLASLESASATNAIYYRSASDTWSTVTVGGGLGFTTGSLTITNVALTALGSVTPAADRLPYFTGATTAGLATFTAAARTLLSQPDAPSMVGVLGAQPLDADLTSLAAATGTNTIYYRSAAGTWSPVVVGTNLTFAGGTLAATGGGGDVFKNLTNTFTQVNYFSGAAPNVVVGHDANIDGAALAIHGAPGASGQASITKWTSTALNGAELAFKRSRSNTIGTHTALAAGDNIGTLSFWGSNGTSFVNLASITSDQKAGLAAGSLSFLTHNGSAFAERMRLHAGGGLSLGTLVGSDGGNGVIISNGLQIKQISDSLSSGLQLIPTGGTNTAYMFSDGSNLALAVTGTNQIVLAYNAGVSQLAVFRPTFCSIKGSDGVNDQAAGYVGEYKENTATSFALGAGAYTPCVSVFVPVGEWDIKGTVHVTAGTAHTTVYGVITTAPGTSTNNAVQTASGSIGSAFNELYLHVGEFRTKVTSGTTFYLNVYPAAGCTHSDSSIQARRRN